MNLFDAIFASGLARVSRGVHLNVLQRGCACAFVNADAVESDSSIIEEQLRELMKGLLPRFKQPRKCIFVGELPYTATEKIQRFKLRQRLRQSFEFQVLRLPFRG